MCAKWVEDFSPAPLLDRLYASARVDGEKVSFSDAFTFHDNMSILMEGVDFGKSIPSSERHRLAWSSLVSGAKGARTKPSDFVREVTRLEHEYINRPATAYYYLSTVSLRWRSEFKMPRFSACSTQFYETLPAFFDRSPCEPVIRSTFRHRELPKDYTYLRAAVSARGVHEAADKARDVIEFFRGAWNLFVNRRYGTRQFGGRPEPINRILPGPFSTLHDRKGKSIDERIWYDPGYVEPRQSYDFSDWAAYLRFQKWLLKHVDRHRYRQNIEEMLRTYSRALDEVDYDVAIVRLWSLLEQLANAGSNYDLIIRRVSFLFEDFEFNRVILQHLRRYRNRAIHGYYSSERRNEAVHQLRRFVQEALLFHIRNAGRAASVAEACVFLDLPPDLKHLRRKRALVERGIKFRQPAKPRRARPRAEPAVISVS